jgi:hypothetical protein
MIAETNLCYPSVEAQEILNIVQIVCPEICYAFCWIYVIK